MKKYRFALIVFILLTVQVLLGNYFGLSRYVLLSVLPAIMLMLPLEWGGIPLMIAAFAGGFAVDFFSTGLLGLSSAALVVVALLRNTVVGAVFGDELSSRGEQLTTGRLGLPRFALALLILCSLYFLVYVWADAAGTSTFWREALRFALSVFCSTPLCLLCVHLLRPE